eukprot:4682305-Prymnesium_polylepis.1
MRRAAGTVELVGHVGHRLPVIRILRVAHPPAHLRPEARGYLTYERDQTRARYGEGGPAWSTNIRTVRGRERHVVPTQTGGTRANVVTYAYG